MGTQMLVLVEAGHAGGPGEAGPRPFTLLWGWVGWGCWLGRGAGRRRLEWQLQGQHFKEQARGYSGEIPKRMQGFEQREANGILAPNPSLLSLGE